MSNTPRSDRAAFSIRSKDDPDGMLVVPLALARQLELEAGKAIPYESLLRDLHRRLQTDLEEPS